MKLLLNSLFFSEQKVIKAVLAGADKKQRHEYREQFHGIDRAVPWVELGSMLHKSYKHCKCHERRGGTREESKQDQYAAAKF